MKIVVFDDNDQDRLDLLNMIRRWAGEQSINDLVIREYDSVQSLSFDLPELHSFDIFFLDIMTPHSHNAGFRLAEKIRSESIRATIIFTTNSAEYMSDAFEIFTYRYLLKPVNAKKLFEALDSLREARSITGRYATVFHVSGQELLVENDQVLYLEVNARLRLITIRKTDGSSLEARITDSFNRLLESLPDEFIQCHRGFVINSNHVEGYSNKAVFLRCGEEKAEIPLGKKFREDFINKLIDYHKGTF